MNLLLRRMKSAHKPECGDNIVANAMPSYYYRYLFPDTPSPLDAPPCDHGHFSETALEGWQIWILLQTTVRGVQSSLKSLGEEGWSLNVVIRTKLVDPFFAVEKCRKWKWKWNKRRWSLVRREEKRIIVANINAKQTERLTSVPKFCPLSCW